MPKSFLKNKGSRNVRKTPKSTKAKNKIGKVMSEFYHHNLHSGSHTGPVVTNVHQAQVLILLLYK